MVLKCFPPYFQTNVICDFSYGGFLCMLTLTPLLWQNCFFQLFVLDRFFKWWYVAMIFRCVSRCSLSSLLLSGPSPFAWSLDSTSTIRHLLWMLTLVDCIFKQELCKAICWLLTGKHVLEESYKVGLSLGVLRINSWSEIFIICSYHSLAFLNHIMFKCELHSVPVMSLDYRLSTIVQASLFVF